MRRRQYLQDVIHNSKFGKRRRMNKTYGVVPVLKQCIAYILGHVIRSSRGTAVETGNTNVGMMAMRAWLRRRC